MYDKQRFQAEVLRFQDLNKIIQQAEQQLAQVRKVLYPQTSYGGAVNNNAPPPSAPQGGYGRAMFTAPPKVQGT